MMAARGFEDRRWMEEAFAAAREAAGRTRPNPAVGCVIARDGRLIGRGFHRQAGMPHAEREALAACVEDPAGATAYVTLEPCSHHGRTPPCVDALIEARIARVVIAQEDPNPVAGGGAEALRRAGIEVEAGLMRGEALRLNPGFNTLHLLGRPLATLKWAMSADGLASADGGHSAWISGTESRRRAHALRAEHDMVIVGRATAEADNARLTIRDAPVPPGPPLVRAVVDSRFALRPDHPLVADASSPSLVVGTESAPAGAERRLRDAGAETMRVAERDGRVDLGAMMRAFAARGWQSVLVEGGRVLAGAMMAEGLADRVRVFAAPVVIGSGPAALSPLVAPSPIRSMDDARRLLMPEWTPCGEDMMLSAWITTHLLPEFEE